MSKVKNGNKAEQAAQKTDISKLSKMGEGSQVCKSGMIAEAVYYKAEKRGFVLGYDAQDWLEAEEEVQNSHKGCLLQDAG